MSTFKQLLEVGGAGVEVMNLLSEAHTAKFGVPTPVRVSQNKVEGKAILVRWPQLARSKSAT